jgi:hypothetical protein
VGSFPRARSWSSHRAVGWAWPITRQEPRLLEIVDFADMPGGMGQLFGVGQGFGQRGQDAGARLVYGAHQ